MNVGYARGLFEEYLRTPKPFRPSGARFESGDPDLLQSLPGLARLLETLRADGDGVTPPAPAPPQRSGTGARGRRPRAAWRRGRRGVTDQGPPHPRASRRTPRPARTGAGRRPCARARAARSQADARTACASRHPSSGWAWRARRWPTSSRGSARPTAGRSPTRSSTSPTIRSARLRQAIESGRYRSPLTDDEKKRMLARLTEVEGFEHYLRRAFLAEAVLDQA